MRKRSVPNPLLLALSLAMLCSPALGNEPTKKIDFEDEVVEGLNKQPLDSFAQISEKNRRKKNMHLYNKKTKFTTENGELIRELRYIQ